MFIYHISLISKISAIVFMILCVLMPNLYPNPNISSNEILLSFILLSTAIGILIYGIYLLIKPFVKEK